MDMVPNPSSVRGDEIVTVDYHFGSFAERHFYSDLDQVSGAGVDGPARPLGSAPATLK
jgi:hypothetical protein